jgi:hypothetical protein
MRDVKPFLLLGQMLSKKCALAESQDKISWRNFPEGYISTHFYSIQQHHLAISSSYLNGADWTRQYISKILQITHTPWIYRNISLRDKRQGYLHHKRAEELYNKISELSDLAPYEVPENSCFLLKINFTELTSANLETQRYWTLAVNAALKAQSLEAKRGARLTQIRKKLNRKIPSRKKLSVVAFEHQIQADRMHITSTKATQANANDHTQTTLASYIKMRPHPSNAINMLKSN